MSDSAAPEFDDWILDFEYLLAPVSEENPCGTEQYQGFVEAQRGLFEMLGPKWCEQGYGTVGADVEKKVEDFLRESQAIFASKCKSLELPVVCAPLMVQTFGLAGLRDALEWVNRSLQTYGAQLFPTHPNGIADSANRLTRIFRSQFFVRSGVGAWSNLAHQVRMLPITSERDNPKVYADLFAVFGKAGENKPDYPYDMQMAAEATSSDFYHDLQRTLGYCIELCPEITANFRAAYDCEEIHAMRLIPHELVAFLEEFQKQLVDFAESFCPDFYLEANAGNLDKEHFTSTDSGSDGGNEGGVILQPEKKAGELLTAFDGSIRNREDAIRMLDKVAHYFMENELHSPVGYRLQEALEWTRLSLPELLYKLVGTNKEMFGQLTEKLGVEVEVEDDE